MKMRIRYFIRVIYGYIVDLITKNKNELRLGKITYQCNVCGIINVGQLEDLSRENPSCICFSTVRSRSIIHHLSLMLFNESYTLPNFPVKKNIKGYGLSDWEGYSFLLEKKFDYTNTFFHQEPFLDITQLPESKENILDFLISSEVFEHVLPPSDIVIKNSFRLLKPNGILILTVPYAGIKKIEHFPELHDYQIVNQGENKILINTTKDGREQIFENLIFHGGDGETLEMRIYSGTDLLHELQEAGFIDIKFHHETFSHYGIVWFTRDSLPITARKPK